MQSKNDDKQHNALWWANTYKNPGTNHEVPVITSSFLSWNMLFRQLCDFETPNPMNTYQLQCNHNPNIKSVNNPLGLFLDTSLSWRESEIFLKKKENKF